MIYKFKSQAAADVIMREPDGRRILHIIGKDAGPTGIITVAQVPRAIAALEAAVAQDEAKPQPPDSESDDPLEAERRADTVRLRQRVVPFVDLLRTSADAGRDVVWGV